MDQQQPTAPTGDHREDISVPPGGPEVVETHENGLIQFVKAGEPTGGRKRLPAAQQIRIAAERIRLWGARVDQHPDQYYALFEPVVGAAIAELLDIIAADMDKNEGMPTPEWLPALTAAKLMNAGDV